MTFGLAFRFAQYQVGSSLWIDEAMLSNSIVSRPYSQLVLRPLEYNQVAPPLFLVLGKFFARVVEPIELGLRLPALLFSIASIVAFAVLVRRVLSSFAPAVAICVFALSPLLVAYAGEVKQYSGDVLAAVLTYVVAEELIRSGYTRRTEIIAIVCGAAASLWSDASVIVLAAVGAILVLVAWLNGERHALKPAVRVATGWAVVVVLTVAGALLRTADGTREVMRIYWERAFLPTGNISDALIWLWRSINDVYSAGLGLRSTYSIPVLLACLGLVAMYRDGKRDIMLITFAPVVVTLVLSASALYPFSGRLTLFLLPSFIMMFAAGVERASRVFPSGSQLVGALLVVSLLNPASYVYLGAPPPWRSEEVRPLVTHVANEARTEDGVYVFYGATPAARFYIRELGIQDGSWIMGGAYRENITGYFRELDQLRQYRRGWILFAHDIIPGERDSILAYVSKFGRRNSSRSFPGKKSVPGDAAVFLFEFNKHESGMPRR